MSFHLVLVALIYYSRMTLLTKISSLVVSARVVKPRPGDIAMNYGRETFLLKSSRALVGSSRILYICFNAILMVLISLQQLKMDIGK